MLAAVISHELRHISDARNRLFQSHISGDCLTRETRAYETEGRFMAWYTEALVGERLPVQGEGACEQAVSEEGFCAHADLDGIPVEARG